MGKVPQGHRWTIIAVIVLVTGFPVAVWWVVGDQSSVQREEADYLIRPPAISAEDERAIGIASIVATAAALLTLTWAAVTRRFDQRWWIVVALLLAAGFVIGAAWRVMTAGVIGANIGAGMLLLAGTPVLAALLACAMAIAHWTHMSRD